MQTDPSSIQILFAKYVKGEASVEETERLFQLIGETQHDPEIMSLLDSELAATAFADEYNPDWETTLNKIKKQVFEEPVAIPSKKRNVRIWPRIAIAAAVATVIFGASLFYFSRTGNSGAENIAYQNDVAPGKIGATLTLANGKKIKLSDASNGELAKEAGLTISKSADGQVVYSAAPADASENRINTLSTAKGETYMLTLSDKTQVWLNAASSLTYSAALNEHEQRRVKLKGEAYFQVAKDKKHPFIVETDKQTVEVLGTHFNVNSYADEPATRTTLLEGSVKVTGKDVQRILTPGEESSVSGNQIKVAQVDPQDVVAWKDGKFLFQLEEVQSIMRKIARWYDVDIEYQGDIRSETIWGSVSKYKNVSEVLDMLASTKIVKFRIEGRKITVMPYKN